MHDGLFLIAGTYERQGGAGLCTLARQAGEWTIRSCWPAVTNVSFGVHSERFGLHYFVDETHGMITACRWVEGQWQLVGRFASGGAQPCHLALDELHVTLACANYGDGMLSLFSLDLDRGLPTEPPICHAGRGRGPDPERQAGPHAHWVGHDPERKWLYQVDLGTDSVRALQTRDVLETPMTVYKAMPGSGPRHLAFHPRLARAYLVSELASTVTILATADGELRPLGTLSTLPRGFEGQSLGGHIGFNQAGTRLFVSNRGHDSIAIFECDAAGELCLLGHVPSGGASPRFFLLLEEVGELLVANEEGHVVSVLRCDGSDGWRAHARLSLRSPAFLARLA